MKRFHVHVAVADLEANIAFYSAMFGTAPSVVQADYAKWMLDDPRVNFAISSRGLKTGIDHLGVQVDSDSELVALRGLVEQAQIAAQNQSNAACCYARSDKYWITDPQGIAWETFRTLDSIPVYGTTVRPAIPKTAAEAACCAPAATTVAIPSAKNGACCS